MWSLLFEDVNKINDENNALCKGISNLRTTDTKAGYSRNPSKGKSLSKTRDSPCEYPVKPGKTGTLSAVFNGAGSISAVSH